MGAARPAELDCELFGEGFFGQPANAVTSLAFVAVGLGVLASGRLRQRQRTVYGLLIVTTGAGSVIFHGPAPEWSGVVHDLPLVALIAFVAADAASDLAGRRLTDAWWLVPSVAAVAVSAIGEPVRLAAQATLATAAVGLSVLRWQARPQHRRTIVRALLVLGTGALIGTLSRSGGPLCHPDSLFQGHAVWHVMAASAVGLLTPVIGRVGSRASRLAPGR
ncbi:hypothetical protein G1H11_01955 [Phytoactinopolyspora alkaliphila]|uniref:Ceramidase n=2 Tax=Phytoactinopolyspora alkaliphila TaxID=1783498 RepID=A0A6N9YGL6_9ACTN|nr:hypothetical protein [Phytoactinopolyspora alkaliphila]